MTESALYQKIKKALPLVHFTRIENSIGSGMFDVNACYVGQEFWIELKIDKGVNDRNVLIRSSQYAWSTMRQRAGGKLLLLAYQERTRVIDIYKPPFLVTPTNKPEVLRLTSGPFCSFPPTLRGKEIFSKLFLQIL